MELFRAAWEKAQPWFSYLLEDLITTHGLDIEGRVRVLEELRPFVQALTDPVEQDLWLRATSDRLGVDAAALRRSLTCQAPISAARLDPRTNLAVSLEKAVIRWVLAHPDAITLEELEEWAVEFENRELKGLLDLIINSYREHGRLDYGLLVQQAAGDTQRQYICALTLEEDESGGPAGDFLAADWRRNLCIRRLKKTRAQLKEKLKSASGAKGDDLSALLAKQQEIHQQIEHLKCRSTTKGENG